MRNTLLPKIGSQVAVLDAHTGAPYDIGYTGVVIGHVGKQVRIDYGNGEEAQLSMFDEDGDPQVICLCKMSDPSCDQS